MNRLELVDRVAARNTASKAEVGRIIVSALEEIISAVRCGESVTLIGFGTFKAVDCAPRTGQSLHGRIDPHSRHEEAEIRTWHFLQGAHQRDQVIQPFISRPHQRLEVG